MKIIERGIKPDDVVHEARCTRCRTLVEFERREARFVSDRDGDSLVVTCPVCEQEIWTPA